MGASARRLTCRGVGVGAAYGVRGGPAPQGPAAFLTVPVAAVRGALPQQPGQYQPAREQQTVGQYDTGGEYARRGGRCQPGEAVVRTGSGRPAYGRTVTGAAGGAVPEQLGELAEGAVVMRGQGCPSSPGRTDGRAVEAGRRAGASLR